MGTNRRPVAALAAVVLAAALSACGGDDSSSPATTTAATTTAVTGTTAATGTTGATGATGTTGTTGTTGATTSTTTGVPAASTTSTSRPSPSSAGTAPTTTAPFAGTTDPTTIPAGRGTALLTAVRSGVQPGYDRVVFEFDGTGLPGVAVAYTPRPIRADASGDEVAIEGDAVLVVRMSPAAGVDLSGNTAIITYTGPTRLAPRQANVVEIVRTGDFEGVLTWAIGLRARTAYRVLTLESPSRVVIDIVTT